MTAVRGPAIRTRQRVIGVLRDHLGIVISATGANATATATSNAPSPPGSSPANATPRRLPANEGKRLTLS